MPWLDRQADSLGRKSDEMISTATHSALKAYCLILDGLSERMAARRSERLVCNRFAARLPRLERNQGILVGN